MPVADPGSRGDTRRTALLRAAVTVLAEGGTQALTHRAVETAAGATHGSTRYYFATRDRMIEAVLDHLADSDQRAVQRSGEHAFLPASVDGAAAAIVELLTGALTVDRVRSLARYELFLEAARRPELRAPLYRWGAMFWTQAEPLLAALGSTEVGTDARSLIELIDGLLFSQLARPREDFPAAARRAIRAFLSGLS